MKRFDSWSLEATVPGGHQHHVGDTWSRNSLVKNTSHPHSGNKVVLHYAIWPAISSSLTQSTCPFAVAMWRGGPKWTSYASNWAPLAIINFTTSTFPEDNKEVCDQAGRVSGLDLFLLVSFGRQFTSDAGLMQRRRSQRSEGGVDVGSVAQQQLCTLQAPSSTGVTEGCAAVDGSHIHLQETLCAWWQNIAH